jgi:hypothetical protein
MDVKADRAAAEIANIADVAVADASLIPAIINLLNQHPHSTRAAVFGFATELASAVSHS